MKSINSVFFYILLAIVLCIPNVSTFCGNDEQIEDIRTALVKEETIYTALTTLSAIPVTGAPLAVVQMTMSSWFALHLHELFDEMESSLNKDHIDYKKCSELLEMAESATLMFKSTSFGLSVIGMIPGLGLTSLIPRLITSISAMVIIRERLESWQSSGCQYATTRDCNLKVN